MSRLVFPRVERPEVSVLMVTYGGWSFVERALRALADNTPPVYETVIVDNASPDGLAATLREEVEGAILVFNETNRGYGPANDQAAALARGSALALLNSDAFVHPGWLAPLLEALRAPGVACASPRVLNEDGTLQEAGCLLYEDATTEFHGFRDDPASSAYAFPRDVDYSSAACVLIDRSAFFSSGGFDAAFAPAFYEDVDLCLRFRASGLRCVYEPRSVVTHRRGASRSEDASRAMAAKNAAVLRERWAPLLRRRPAWRIPGDADETRRRLAARDALAESRVLVLCPDASRPRVLALLSALAERRPACATTLAALEPLAPLEAERLRASGVEVVSPLDSPAEWLEARRFHYDAVVVCGSAAWRAAGAGIENAQPQADRIVDLSGEAAGGPGPGLRDALRAGDVALTASFSPLAARTFPDVHLVRWAPGTESAAAALDRALAAAGISPATAPR